MATITFSIHENAKVAILNPDVPGQVRQLSGAGAPQWLALSSNPTFANIVTSGTQQGTTGDYLFSITDAGLDTARVYPCRIFDSTATAFSDPASECEVSPETTPATNRAEMDANSTKLDVTVGSRLASAGYTAPDNTNIGVAATQATNAATDAAAVKSRIPAALFSGITSLANWLRLLGRKSGGDATALTELNSGGGTFSPTTDSNEAIKDIGVPATGLPDPAPSGYGGSGGGGLTGPQDTKLTQIHGAIQTLKK